MRFFTLFALISFSSSTAANFGSVLSPITLTNKSHTLLISSELSISDSIELMDSLGQSVAYSLANDQIINGSGTSYQFLYPTQKEGYFTRTLNVLSYYDLYLTSKVQRFLEERLENGEKKQLFLVMAPLNYSYVAELPPYKDSVSLSALDALLPIFKFSVKGIPENAYVLQNGYPQYKNTVFSVRVRQALAEYYYELVKKATIGGANQIERLSAMLALYLPIASQFNFYVEKKNEEESIAKSRIDLYFPAIAQIKDLFGAEKDYRLWEQEGLYQEFETKIETEVVILDGISYNVSEDRNRFPLMRVRIMKDYNNIHEKEVHFTFGIQGGSEQGELISINKGRLDDQLNVFGRVRVKNLSENPVFKIFPEKKREEIFSYIDGFKVDVGIHKLALRLKRDASSDDFQQNFQEDKGFEVRFLPEKSYFTYRIGKLVKDEGVDKLWRVHQHLIKLDFNCEKQEGEEGGYYCSKYFNSSESFQDSLARIVFNELARIALKNTIPVMHKMADEEIGKAVEKLVSQMQGMKEFIKATLMSIDPANEQGAEKSN